LKYLYTNGCSFTWGGGINQDNGYKESDREKLVWPYYLAQLLDRTPIQHAIGCGSNQRMVRTSIDWLVNTPQVILDNTIAVLQTTEAFRMEYYTGKDEYVETQVPFEDGSFWTRKDYTYKHDDEKWIKLNVWGDEYDKSLPTSFKTIHEARTRSFTEVQGMYESISLVLSLDRIFKSLNVKTYWWMQFGSVPKQYPLEYRKLYEDIDIMPSMFYDIIGKHDPHPSPQGHKCIAEQMFDYIKGGLKNAT